MSCGCKDKQVQKEPEIQPIVKVPSYRLAVYCAGCGISRLLPSGLSVGDVFELVACPKCGTGLGGKFIEGGVEEVV